MLKHPFYQYGSPDLQLPVNLNFSELILNKLVECKDKTIINGLTDETLTYGEVAQQSMNVAISLSRLGVRKGQTVGICSENRGEFWSAVVGSICTGAVFTTFNMMYTKHELSYVAEISKPKYIFCSPLAYKMHASTLKSLKFVKIIIVFGNEKLPGTISFNDLSSSASQDDSNEPKLDGFASVTCRAPMATFRLHDQISSMVPLYCVVITTKQESKISAQSVTGNGVKLNLQDLITTRQVSGVNVKYEEFRAVDVDSADDDLFLLYSSGTTGLPKGVLLTHRNVLTASLSKGVDKPSPPIYLIITPWFHTMGLMGTLLYLVSGRNLVYLPKFELELYLKCIEKYKITRITVVPPILVALVKYPQKHDLRSVELVYSGAAPLTKETAEAVRNVFPNAGTVLQGYGMTETTLAVTRDQADSNREPKRGSVGTVSPGAIIKVIDIKTRKPLGPNQAGEICVKGGLVMKGYIGKDRKEDFDGEGFFKTGDIGYYDEDGYFFIVDRLKELIKYKGYQVAPAEIEAILLQHPAVRDAGVVGVPDVDAGEVPRAFVVMQPETSATAEELQKFVAERLSNPKHLRGGVRFVPEIPKNPSGKILRRELRKLAHKKSKL